MKNPPCKRKYYTVIFLVVFLPFLFFNAGCWDREELEELAFVMVIGIDYLPEEEKLEVTTIINHPRGLAMQVGGRGGMMSRFILLPRRVFLYQLPWNSKMLSSQEGPTSAIMR